MKTVLALVLSIALFTFLGCSQQKTEELHGTWINMAYKTGRPPQKVIYFSDGRLEIFKRASQNDADYNAVYKIEEKWTDKEGNIWYKFRVTKKSWESDDSFTLVKISNSGKTQEVQFEYEFYPKKIDSTRLAYRTYNRE